MMWLYHPLQIPLGLIVWGVWFIALYSGLSVGCAVAPPDAAAGPWNWLNAVLGGASLATVGLLLGLSTLCWRASRRVGKNERAKRFIARVGVSVHLVAALATLFIALPIVGLPPCA